MVAITVDTRPASPSTSMSESDSDASYAPPSPVFSPAYPARVRVRSESVSTIVQYSPDDTELEDGEDDLCTPHPGFHPENPAFVQVTKNTTIDMTLSEWEAYSEDESEEDPEDIHRLGPLSPALVQITKETVIQWIDSVTSSQDVKVALDLSS